MSTRQRRARFTEDPVTDVRSFSRASSVSSRAPSPPLPDPDMAFSSPTHIPSHDPISSYPSPSHPRVYTSSPIPQQTRDLFRKVPIQTLPVEVLIKIFDSYRLDPLIYSQLGRPWKWQNLAHVCKTWRSVLLASPHYLGLRLSFTDGMPVRQILSSWPALPIIMHYVEAPGSSPLTLGDQDNIMALLELSIRLREIQLTVTTPLLEKTTTLMQQPFSVLESLHLSTLPGPGLVLPSKFGGSMPRLRVLRMFGFALPALPQLLLSARDLVYLQLEKLPTVGYTLEALTICLPAMTRLKTLRIHFLSPTFRPVLVFTDRPLPSFSVLPVLNFIEFHGTSEYLESLLSGISAPILECFRIRFFNQLIFDTPQLSRFIRRTEMHRLPAHATIHSSEADISIALTHLGVPYQLSLRILCKQLDWQIASMAEVCDRLCLTLANVEQLTIRAHASFPDGKDDMDLIHTQILELFRPFRSVKRLCVTGASLSLVAGALGLVTEEQAMAALPELQEIQTKKDDELAFAQTGLEPFIAARQRSTHRVVVRDTTSRRTRPFASRAFPSPATSVLSLTPSPRRSTRPPLPEVAFSLPTHSPSRAPIPSFPLSSRYRVVTSLSIPQPHALRNIPPAPLTRRVNIHTVLTPPNLQYDMRYHPILSNLRLSPAVLAEPASSPLLLSLPIRVAGFPWHCTVRPKLPSSLSRVFVVTVQDVLTCLYFHLRTAVQADEYNSLSWARKLEIFQMFDRRVGRDPAERANGLRRVDLLGDRVIAQGLVRAQSDKDKVWEVVVR